MTQKQDQKEVSEIIKKAFSYTDRPNSDNIVSLYCQCDRDRLEIHETFRHVMWNEVKLAKLRYHHEALVFFTSEAFIYFLPSYLLACILHYSRSGNIPGSLISALTPPQEGTEAHERFLKKVKLLSVEQKRAVARFLAFMLTNRGADFPGYDITYSASFWDEVGSEGQSIKTGDSH